MGWFWPSIIGGLLAPLFSGPTRAGIAIAVLGSVVTLLNAALGGDPVTVYGIFLGSFVLSGTLIAVRRRGTEGLVIALAVPLVLALLASAAAGFSGSYGQPVGVGETLLAAGLVFGLSGAAATAGYLLTRAIARRIDPQWLGRTAGPVADSRVVRALVALGGHGQESEGLADDGGRYSGD